MQPQAPEEYPKYVIRAARDEESNSGWIWIGGPSPSNPTERCVVRITRPGYRRSLYTEARVIDSNFVNRYNSNPYRPPIVFKNGAVVLNTMVMGDLYRRALGICNTTARDNKSSTISLRVRKANWGVLFAACQSPDAMVRLATRLGVLGTWLGIVALADPVLTVCEEFFRDVGQFTWRKNQLPTFWTREHLHPWLVSIVVIVFALLGWFLCRGRPQPPQRQEPEQR